MPQTHTALLRLARSREGALRLVTTNFDRVFHAAAKRDGQAFRSYAAPMLPIPKKSRWDGLVYLHGVLPEREDETAWNRLVVTSGDFGLAYLTERWAARFVSELFRNYLVCFVGYSINDPVLRYMMDALAADRMLGEAAARSWALGDCEPGQEHRKTIEWEAKNVTPILYQVPSGSNDHSALHHTLRAWADIYRDGVTGKERIVVDFALTRPQGNTRQENFVDRMLWALSDKSGLPAKRFADFNPVPSLDWLLEALSDERFHHGDLIRFNVPPHEQADTKLLPSGLADVTTLASGSHRVGLRFKDCEGAWGAPIYLGLSVCNPFGAEPPAIAVQPPARQIQPPGENASFSILANGTEPLTYQWFKDGAILPGATNAWLCLAGLAAADAGGYQVLVANDYGSVTSRVALLIVGGATYAPEIVVQPVSQTVLAGAPVQLSALVDASWPVYYQWFKDGAALPGAVSTNLVFPAAQRSDSGVYWLVVTNDFGCAVTEPAQLDVDALMAYVGNEPLLGTNTFEGDVVVRFEIVFENGTIFYTLDGSEPDFGAMAYAGPFAMTRSSVLRAVAYNQTFTDWDEMVPVRVTIIPLRVLSASTAGGGTIALDPANGAYRRGTVVTVTATPAPGWTFMGWMGDVLSSDASLVLTMTNNRSLHTVFGTALAAIPSGSGAVLVEPEAAVYPFGAAVRLSAVPANGNFFVVWGGAASGTNNPLTFVVRNPNPTITCLFGVLGADQFALATVPNGFGRINRNPRGNRFPAGQQITLTAIPDPGQTFIGWAGGLAGTNNPQTLVLNSSKIVEALFTAWPTLQPDRENGNLAQEGFRLLLKSGFGASVSVMRSADFAEWMPLLRVTNNFGTLRLLDASSAGVPYRFYRAVPE